MSTLRRPNSWRGMSRNAPPKLRCSTPSRRTCPTKKMPSEWNWSALATFAQTRWGLKVTDRDLKKWGRDHVAEHLIDQAREAIHRLDLSDGKEYLDEDFPLRTVCALGTA